jgi:hypothetical protein
MGGGQQNQVRRKHLIFSYLDEVSNHNLIGATLDIGPIFDDIYRLAIGIYSNGSFLYHRNVQKDMTL